MFPSGWNSSKAHNGKRNNARKMTCCETLTVRRSLARCRPSAKRGAHRNEARAWTTQSTTLAHEISTSFQISQIKITDNAAEEFSGYTYPRICKHYHFHAFRQKIRQALLNTT